MNSLRIAVLITLAGSCGLACAQATPFGQSDDAKPARTASNVAKPAPDTAVNRRKSRLVRMLTGRSERVRYNAVLRLRHDRAQSVASLDELLTALEIQAETLIDSDLPPSLVELVYLVASIDQPKVEEALIKLLDSENADLAMIVADALGRNQFFNAIDDLARQVGCEAYQERYAFRFNLVRSLIQMKHPDAVEVLTGLESHLDGQLGYELDQLLADITVDDFRGDEERYQAWVKKREEGTGFQTVSFGNSTGSPADEQIRFTQPHYYGIDIQARRVMFVIDHSGSMKKPTSSGTRLMRAKQELVRAISELPEQAEFAIVSFDSNVRHWRNELTPATEDNKRAAILYVQRLGYGNDTNTYGALRRALDFDDELEAVFLLTDGKPTTGQIINSAMIARDIIHRNRWRHLNINTIGISVGGPTESFLRSLAANSGGEFRAER